VVYQEAFEIPGRQNLWGARATVHQPDGNRTTNVSIREKSTGYDEEKARQMTRSRGPVGSKQTTTMGRGGGCRGKQAVLVYPKRPITNARRVWGSSS